MGTRYNFFYDQMQSLIDSINHDSDPAERLANLQRIYKDGLTMMLRSRDEAAYELRSRYSSQDAEAVAKVSAKYIDYWAKRHQNRHNLPPLARKRRVDLADVIDLSGRLASPPNLPLRRPERQD